MSCPSDDTLIALLERALIGEALHALEAHVDRCATCRATVGHLAALAGRYFFFSRSPNVPSFSGARLTAATSSGAASLDAAIDSERRRRS